jgi:hypothetical protein
VYEWDKRSSKARQDGENHERPDHPVMIKTTDTVRIHVRTDHCLGIRMTAQEVNRDEQMVRQILRTDLNNFF